MLKFIMIRLTRSLITIWFVFTLVFVFTRITQDPTQWILPDDAPMEARIEMRQRLGLDKPIHEQYLNMVLSLFHGETELSYAYMRPTGELFRERTAATLRLGFLSLALAMVVAVPLGTFAAVHHNTFFDRLGITLSIIGSVIPNFVLGILMIFLFSLVLRWLPSGGFSSWRHFIMPVIAMSVGPMASIARLTRSSMLDVLRQDYLDFARSKGVREKTVVAKHALRNAMIPVITIIGLQFGHIIGGSVVVETVFSWPGIGFLIVNSAQSRDFPVIQHGVILIGASIAIANTMVDICYALLDPRIREKF
jgi:peptide/nickel transport system permease protein